MPSILINLLCMVAAVAAAPGSEGCSENNCLRAVQASAYSTRQGSMDCASYFLTTVTPATSTQTVTVTTSPTTTVVDTVTTTATVSDTATVTTVLSLTVTTTETAVPLLKRDDSHDRASRVTIAARQVTEAPFSIPSYASACSGSVKYSSACSCVGATQSTVTAPTPITVVTVTATASQTLLSTQTSLATLTEDVTVTVTDSSIATETLLACGPTPTFSLQAVGGGGYDGMYAQLVAVNDGLNDEAITFVSSASDATLFQIDAAGHLSAGGYYGNINAGSSLFLFYFNTPADISAMGYVYATCAIIAPAVAGGNMFQCEDQGATMFQIIPAKPDIGAGVALGSYVEAPDTPLSFIASCV